MTRVVHVTPEQFRVINTVLAQANGSPECRIIEACKAVGIEPPTSFQGVRLVVMDGVHLEFRRGLPDAAK